MREILGAVMPVKAESVKLADEVMVALVLAVMPPEPIVTD